MKSNSNTDIMETCDTKNCGAKCCAAILPLSDKEIKDIKLYIKENDIKAVNRNKDQNIFNQKFNDVCPFLSEDLKCNIYPVRSEICREFHCSRHIREFDYKNKTIVNMIDVFYPNEKCLYEPDLKEMNKIYREKLRGAGL